MPATRLVKLSNISWLKLKAVAVIGAVVLLGYVVARSLAAGPLASFEPETASLMAPAKSQVIAGASGGSMVQFGASVTPTPTPAPTATPVAGGPCPQTKRTITAADVTNHTNSGYPAGTQVYVPGGPDPWGGCFPGAGNTGIPAGTVLSAYTGSCTISAAGTVIDSKTISCDLDIRAANVVIRKSKITASNIGVNSGSLTLEDSEIDFGNNINGEGLKGTNFTVTRANMHGGKRQVWCDHCTLQDSYLHDQLSDPTGVTHESSARVEAYATLRHNTFWCNAPDYPPDAGCSANQTGYPDFSPIHDNTFDKNFYMATTGGYCSYGGDNPGKPYNNDPSNATNIKSTSNVFQRGTRTNDRTTIAVTDKRRYTCGGYGVVDSYNNAKAGFVFKGNMWDDGLLFKNDTDYPYGSWLSQMETP